MAEGLMRARIETAGLQDAITVRSAGIAAYAGSPASKDTRDLLDAHGIDFADFRSTPVSTFLLDEVDYILCLSQMHRDAILAHHPEYREKALLVGEFLNSDDAPDIADPYGLGSAAYKQVETELLQAIDNILTLVQQDIEV